MITSVQAWRKAATALTQQHDYRMGFLAGLDRRIFPDLPPMTANINSQEFVDGQRAAIDCPLAVSMPERIHHDYPQDDQYTWPVFVGMALFIIGIGFLWATKV